MMGTCVIKKVVGEGGTEPGGSKGGKGVIIGGEEARRDGGRGGGLAGN